MLQAKREEVRKLEKKKEDLQKMIEEDERREAEKAGLEGGSDGLDEEADAEREEEKEITKLKRMMEKMGMHVPWGMGGGQMRAGGNGGKIIFEERHFRRMEKYDGGEGKWEKWWFDLTTVIGGVDQELERVLVEVTDPTTKVETKEEMVRVVGMELLGKYSGGLFTAYLR